MADHIRITKAPGTWVVRAGGAVLGESTVALELQEGSREPVIYFPRDALAMAFLDRTSTETRCPHKGTATYYSIVTKSTRIEDAGWSYEAPIDGMERIAMHLAFDTDRVTVECV